ncbi:MAG: hypothetical protein CMP73_06140 [Flavobacteriales bacterium]|nr:hypothetical protein [Flavobacteriales bacterium]
MQQETSELKNQLEKLTLDEMIEKIKSFTKTENPYSFSKEYEKIKALFYNKLNEKINSQENENNILETTEKKFKKYSQEYKKIKKNYRKILQEKEEKNLKIKKGIIEEIKQLTLSREIIKETFEKFYFLQEKWKETGHVPLINKSDIWQSYHHNIVMFYDYIKLNKDLRDLDFKKNLELKESICIRAEKIASINSINKMHLALQELHEEWKKIGPVDKNNREQIWLKFQKISRKINKKRNDYFIELKKIEKEKIKQKMKICVEIEKLIHNNNNSYKEWKELTKKCEDLVGKWKAIKGLSKKSNSLTWKKLSSVLDIFYNKKKEIHEKIRKEDNKKIEKRKLLLKKANEIISNKRNSKEISNKIIDIQKEWKLIAAPLNKKSIKLNTEFNILCNSFFKEKKERIKKIKKENKIIEVEKKNLLKKLIKFDITKNKDDLISNIINQWIELNKKKRNLTNDSNLDLKFLKTVEEKYKQTKMKKKDIQRKVYQVKIDIYRGNERLIISEKHQLNEQILKINQEINLYENNMQYLGNNNKTLLIKEKTLKEIEKRKLLIIEIKEKLKLIK